MHFSNLTNSFVSFFQHGKQEDAEEFLSCILDGMHEEMSAAVTLINKNEKSGRDHRGLKQTKS